MGKRARKRAKIVPFSHAFDVYDPFYSHFIPIFLNLPTIISAPAANFGAPPERPAYLHLHAAARRV